MLLLYTFYIDTHRT